MGRIIDSEAHPWVRLPSNWRHRAATDEKRAPLGARAAANFKPARPAADGSFAHPEETASDLLALMDLFGIDVSVIYPGPCMCPNDEIARVVALAPDRFVGFAKSGAELPPFSSPRAAQAACDEIEHGLRDLKLRGLAELSLGEWLPASLETAVAEMHDWFELARHYGDLPVIVHAHAGGGAKDADYCDPEAFRSLAEDFPTVPLILNHMGGARRDFFDHALALARDCENVCFNTSQTLPEHLSEAVAKIGAERIFFGVDWYALDKPETRAVSQHGNQLAIVEQAVLTDRERALVLGEGIATLLRI
jgi:predicted TIM-barrel fold metal-dependent hydrolase